MPATDFDPRAATLRYAAIAHDTASEMAAAQVTALNAVAFALLYVGDQLAPVQAQLEEIEPATVKVVDMTETGSWVTLEMHGQQFQLQVGDSLEVPGLRVIDGNAGD